MGRPVPEELEEMNTCAQQLGCTVEDIGGRILVKDGNDHGITAFAYEQAMTALQAGLFFVAREKNPNIPT